LAFKSYTKVLGPFSPGNILWSPPWGKRGGSEDFADAQDSGKMNRRFSKAHTDSRCPVLISHLSTFPLSHFKLTILHLAKFEQWLIDTLNTTLRFRAKNATQISMLRPIKLLRISQLPTLNWLYHVLAVNFNGGWLTHWTHLWGSGMQMPLRFPPRSLRNYFIFPRCPVLFSHFSTFLLSHFGLSILHLGSKFEWWLIDTPNTTPRLRTANDPQISTLWPINLLWMSQLPIIPLRIDCTASWQQIWTVVDWHIKHNS
jgi:hypothetical protein